MRSPILDLESLRSFAAGVELGTFVRAAEHVGRSTSAVSAQLRKLEQQVGSPILQKSGRSLVLTSKGEVLLAYARRLLDLNAEAVASLREADQTSCLRIGLQEDFSDHVLTGALRDFADACPRVRVETRIARNAELLRLIETGVLDLALAWDSGRALPHSQALGGVPMCWIESRRPGTSLKARDEALPLVVVEAPCLMRNAATQALDRAGIAWRIALTSVSLSGVWAAVSAGLGITVRTRIGLPASLVVRRGFPRLPSVGVVLCHNESRPPSAIKTFSEILRDRVKDAMSSKR